MNRIQNETGQQAVKVVSLRIWSAEEDSGAFHGERALAAVHASEIPRRNSSGHKLCRRRQPEEESARLKTGVD